MKGLAFGLDRIAALGAVLGEILAAIAVVGMFAHIVLEIVMRAVFATSTFVLDEFVGYMVAALIFGAAGGCLRSKTHLRVGLLLDRLGFRARAVAECFALLALIFVAVLLTQYYFAAADRAWTRGTVSQTVAEVPLWIPLGMAMLGAGNLVLQGVARLGLILTGQLQAHDFAEEMHDA
ncbi:TRAP transporter small permease [Acuticoccus sp. M5D2P5]|uniref:TRAP transporter small permease subunit n=1 Tax=Acuticoccus kalidii TaxID=2910977 RepID=UPI001F320885|nr:TRAP transporter small permease [Acuticoccus kalidii]MCF3934806.1 TRAP transporter small permease [Acuticoccus kalidii]